MTSQIFLISFSHNDQIITVDRCRDYDKLTEEIVDATNGQIQIDDIESFEYTAIFGDINITITARNSKGLIRIPNQEFYPLKCITKFAKSNDKTSMNNNTTIQKSINHNNQHSDTQHHIHDDNDVSVHSKSNPPDYKLSGLSRKQDSM